MSALSVQSLSVNFPTANGVFRAVDDVSFTVQPGEIAGLVGESGSGKSTIARAVLRIDPISEGHVMLEGKDITTIKGPALRAIRRDLQMVFQDPMASLNPRLTAGETVAETLRAVNPGLSSAELANAAAAELEAVGLARGAAHRYPHEFSGGQRQRIAIARAIITKPKLLICDECVSALDVSVQAHIVNLLKDLRDRYGMAILFITHDLAVVRHACDRTLVLYHGKLVEEAENRALFEAPAHPYTRELMGAVPRISDESELPPPRAVASSQSPRKVIGCRYAPRCDQAFEQCGTEPPLAPRATGKAACWLKAEARADRP